MKDAIRSFMSRKFSVPLTNETKEIDVVQLWDVRWTSLRGHYSFDKQPELETFFSEQEAREFSNALSDAFRLIRMKVHTEVVMSKRR